MKKAISTACFGCETEAAAKKIKDLGAQNAEIAFKTFYEYRPEFSKRLAPEIAGLNVVSVRAFAPNFEYQLFKLSRRVRGDGFYWLDQIMRSAQLFGAKNYTFHGVIRKPSTNEHFDGWGAYMREITEFCARYGVSLCLENTAWGTYNRPGIFSELKNRCQGLKGVFDIKQARQSGYPYTMYLKDMCGAISYAHLSDVDEEGHICLPGKGIYGFAEIFARLNDAGFDGPVLIETPDFNDLSELKTSLEFLRETADKYSKM